MTRHLMRAAILLCVLLAAAAQATAWAAVRVGALSRSLATALRARVQLQLELKEADSARFSASEQPSKPTSRREQARRSGYAHRVDGKIQLGRMHDMSDLPYPDEASF